MDSGLRVLGLPYFRRRAWGFVFALALAWVVRGSGAYVELRMNKPFWALGFRAL